MNFLALLYGAEVLSQSGDPGISGLEHDSRRIKPATCSSPCGANPVTETSSSIRRSPQVRSRWSPTPPARTAPRCRLGTSASRTSGPGPVQRQFLQKPAERLAISGITGTNGKSTTAFLIESILGAAGRKSCAGRNHRIPRSRKDSTRAAHHARIAGTEPDSGRSAGARAQPKR